MFWHGRCFGAVDVMAQSMFWCSQYLSVVNFSACQCFGVVDVSVQSMLQCGRCYGTVDVSTQLMFRHGKCFARNNRNRQLGYKINYWLMKYIITRHFLFLNEIWHMIAQINHLDELYHAELTKFTFRFKWRACMHAILWYVIHSTQIVV